MKIERDSTQWIIRSTGNGRYVIQNADNPGYFLTHTGPAHRSENARNVKIESDSTQWIVR